MLGSPSSVGPTSAKLTIVPTIRPLPETSRNVRLAPASVGGAASVAWNVPHHPAGWAKGSSPACHDSAPRSVGVDNVTRAVLWNGIGHRSSKAKPSPSWPAKVGHDATRGRSRGEYTPAPSPVTYLSGASTLGIDSPSQ